MKIAALLDDEGLAASPEAGGTVHVFQREDDNWVASRSLRFAGGQASATMRGVREQIAGVSTWLGDCKVLAARATIGYYRVTFAGFEVALWPVHGRPEDFVEEIERYYRQAAAIAAQPEPAKPSAVIEPVPEQVGHYRVDLRGVMGSGSHSSRQVLGPFLRKANFARLDIICDHVPRWFATDLPELGLRSTEESVSDFTEVHVYPMGSADRDGLERPRMLELHPVGVTVDAGAAGCGGGGGGGGCGTGGRS